MKENMNISDKCLWKTYFCGEKAKLLKKRNNELNLNFARKPYRPSEMALQGLIWHMKNFTPLEVSDNEQITRYYLCLC